LNYTETDQDAVLPIPEKLRNRKLYDLYNDPRSMQVKNKKISVALPQKSARVYMAR